MSSSMNWLRVSVFSRSVRASEPQATPSGTGGRARGGAGQGSPLLRQSGHTPHPNSPHTRRSASPSALFAGVRALLLPTQHPTGACPAPCCLLLGPNRHLCTARVPRVTAGREGGVKAGWVLPATRWDPLCPFAAVLTLSAGVQHRDLHLLAFTISPVNAIILLQKKGHPVRWGYPGHPQVPSPALELGQTPGPHSQG